MRFLFLCSVLAGFLLFCSPVQAADQDAFSQKMHSEESLKADKENALSSLKAELSSTSEKLVHTAKAIQKSENILQNLDQKIEQLELEQETLESNLNAEQVSLSHLLLALERLRRMPPEALIVKPDLPLKTAQSALLLQDILPALQKRANSLRDNIQRLSVISNELLAQKKTEQKENEDLLQEQKKLEKLVGVRKALYLKTHDDIKQQEEKIAHISAQSKTLSDLVGKLRDSKVAQKNQPEDDKRTQKVLSNDKGAVRLPVSGVLVTRFNEPDNFGAPSQGIDIEARAGALVVAPMGGVVRFAGHFKNYGNMIIVEHEKGWHSLIAGLKKIDTVVGQSVETGEPLGRLDRSSAGSKPRLYYELRHNGKAVNPARKFSDLS